MYCPSCGKQVTENSKFCSYCGTRIAAPAAPVAAPPAPTEWISRDFVYEFPPPGQGPWAKLGSGAYSQAGAKLEFWQNSQREITTELQEWVDEGWQPVGEVGPSCIEIKTSYSHRDKSAVYWLMFLFFSIPTFGLLFLIALLSRSEIAEPTRFVLTMRAPKGAKIPGLSEDDILQTLQEPETNIEQVDDLSAPKQITWWVALILAVLGVLGYFVIPVLSAVDFWLVLLGFVVLLLGTRPEVSRPTVAIALVLAVLGVLGYFVQIPVLSPESISGTLAANVV